MARVDEEEKEKENGDSPSPRTPPCPTPGHVPAEVGSQMGRWRFIIRELYFLFPVLDQFCSYTVKRLNNPFATAYPPVLGAKLVDI